MSFRRVKDVTADGTRYKYNSRITIQLSPSLPRVERAGRIKPTFILWIMMEFRSMNCLHLRFWSIIGLLIAASVTSCLQAAEFRQDIEYASVEGESLKLDVSIPDGDGPFPVAILIHGGGWGGGDKSVVYVPPTEPFTEAKFVWFSIDYRLAPKHHWPACIDDVRTAIRWVKEHAAEFKGDPNRIVARRLFGRRTPGCLRGRDGRRFHAAPSPVGPRPVQPISWPIASAAEA